MKTYYNLSDTKYPRQVLEIIERIRYYILDILYSSEPFDSAKKRFVLANISAGSGEVIHEAIEQFQASSMFFPFTAYAIEGEIDLIEEKSTKPVLAKTYSDTHDCFMSTFPVSFEIPMISFFNTPEDYFRARHILNRERASLLRLQVPISINGVNTNFPIDITIDITKGEFAGEFEEHLRVSNIFDINHIFRIKYYHIIVYTKNSALFNKGTVLDKDLTDAPGSPNVGDRYLIISGTGTWAGKDGQIAEYYETKDVYGNVTETDWVYDIPLHNWLVYVTDEDIDYKWDGTNSEWIISSPIIAPVDDMEAALSETDDEDQRINEEEATIPDEIEISSTSPNNEDTGVARNSSITIDFNIAMEPESVETSIDIDPFISVDYAWNTTDTQLTISPINLMEANTKYTITISDTAKGGYPSIFLLNEYEFEFTTGS